jgi:hypothetical protein
MSSDDRSLEGTPARQSQGQGLHSVISCDESFREIPSKRDAMPETEELRALSARAHEALEFFFQGGRQDRSLRRSEILQPN